MISAKILRTILFVCLSVFVLSSCKDPEGNITIEKPVLVVTPTITNVGAGDNFPFSVDGSGLNKLTKLTVEENYEGKKRMVLDSTFNPPKPGVTFAYNYHVPDSATKDQTIILTFSLTDEKGNVTVDTETFKINYSKPTITLTGDKKTASHGDQVNFVAKIGSAMPNLKQLEITESLNGKLGTVIKTFDIPANTAKDSISYTYNVPHDVQSGQYIVLLFKVINDENVSTTATHRIEIK